MKSSAWREPVQALAPFAEENFAVLLLSDGSADARWSYLARRPDRVEIVTPGDADRDFTRLSDLLGARAAGVIGGPPFQGGVIALVAYEFADRLEPLILPRDADWPDLLLARYSSVLAFDHVQRLVVAVGRGEEPEAAETAANEALTWLDSQPPVASHGRTACAFVDEKSGRAYEAAVRDVTVRIAAGEIFQANIARTWVGALEEGATPFAGFHRLSHQSPAPYSAFWRGPGLALVSHSPEQFLSLASDGASVTCRPIKGTRPRGGNAGADTAQAEALLASDKDRAENLMIVDLVRNDLSRVCAPGSVKVPALFSLESYPSVHHLVSTITGRLQAGRTAADLLTAAFPPGSITGAPKIQAMKVIAGHEPPRGPWCGTLAWVGFDGAMQSSVLIRTAAFVQDRFGWRFRATAGAGIVADSDPDAERLETEVKVSGLRRALTGCDA